MHPFLVAFVICFIAVIVEAVAAGANPRAYLQRIHQPTWALPFWSWYVVGFFFYGACLVSLFLVLRHDPSLGIRWRAIELLIAIMILNPIWNLVFFRLRRVDWSFWLFVPFVCILVVTVYVLYWVDGEAAAAFIPYLLYLPYGGAWSYSVWRGNKGAGAGGTRSRAD